jgi:hypothetical protein
VHRTVDGLQKIALEKWLGELGQVGGRIAR